MPKRIDLTGQRFERLTVIKYYGKANDRHSLWVCECDCGNEKVISGNSLKAGLTKSCGCLNNERVKNLKLSHGEAGTRLHRIWKNIRQRCHNPNHPRYKDYGGRGITVCDEWDSYESFRNWSLRNGYSDNLSIDRIDNDGNYEPENCRWATILEQAHNKGRKTDIAEDCGSAIKGQRIDIYVADHDEALSRGRITREVWAER